MAKKISTTRSTMAPAVPQRMPLRRSSGGKLRQARAMTIALSPPSRMSIMMIWPTASQNSGVRKASMSHKRNQPLSVGAERRPRGAFQRPVCARAHGCSRRSRTGSDQRLQDATHLGRVARDLETALFHDGQLGIGRVGTTGDQRAGVAHALARGRGDTGDEADDGLFHVGLAPLGGFGFVRAADLANHDDGIGVRVVVERLHDVDVLEAVDRVTADAHGAGLTQAEFGQLSHGFVRQRAGARDHADATLAVDVAGHDADLDLFGRDQAGAVGAQQQGLLAAGRFLGLHLVAHHQHVAHGDAFGDGDDQVQVGLDGFPDGVSGTSGRHVDDGHGGAGLLRRFLHRSVDGDVRELLAGLLGVHARNESVLAVGIGLAAEGVELTGLARDALGDDLGVLVDEDAHDVSFLGRYLTAATILVAASAIVSTLMMGRPESASIFLPRSSLVPFMRTTSGTFRFTALQAVMTPSAMVSHFMMPPKMLTRMPFTLGLLSMILKASVTFSAVAPPPTSRKLAGSPPNSLMVSMVAMARPAPLTRQPMLPSSWM